MVATFLYSWVYNGSRGNVWIAIVLHASGNAATQLTNELVPKDVEFTGFMKVLESGWVNLIAFGIVAILLLILTRGTLGYRPEREDVA
jgi:membrane protease YdiL (CAAX protease family)